MKWHVVFLTWDKIIIHFFASHKLLLTYNITIQLLYYNNWHDFILKISLKEKWTALYDVRTILLSIQSLLGEPNLESPLDSHAANMWGHKDFKKIMLHTYENSTKETKSEKWYFIIS